MMVIYLVADPMDALKQYRSTRCAHVKFSWLETLYKNKLEFDDDADKNDLQVGYRVKHALRCYFSFLVSLSMFEKSATYIDVAYLKYFINLRVIHK